jgi:hypothetical protein
MKTVRITCEIARRILEEFGFASLYEPDASYCVATGEEGTESLRVAGRDESLATNPFTAS